MISDELYVRLHKEHREPNDAAKALTAMKAKES